MATTTTHQPTKPNVICIDSGRLRFAEKQAASARGAKRREQWTGWRLHARALSVQSCALCYGLGSRLGKNATETVCNCVFRRIFVACLAKFRQCLDGYADIGKVDWTVVLGQKNSSRSSATWSLRNEEYMADFQLVAFRALNDGKTREQLAEEGLAPSIYWKLFALHMLLGADWKVCCRKLKLDRGTFFHMTYRIQAVLGLAFVDTEPHALFPLDEYFSPMTRRKASPLEVVPDPKRRYCA
jgi:hypothetical protein